MGNSKFVSAVYAPPTMTYCPLMIIVTSWDAYKVDLTMSLYHISCFYSDFRSFHNGLGNQTEGLLTNSILSSRPNIDFQHKIVSRARMTVISCQMTEDTYSVDWYNMKAIPKREVDFFLTKCCENTFT